MSKMDFLKTFDKDVEKMTGIGTSSQPPRYWYSTGNYALNKVMSGSLTKGIPQGRITDLAGPSGAGKSFLAANLVASAQKAGAYCIVIDSENALDDDFMTKIGVDVENNYRYFEVTTIPHVTKLVSSFLSAYKAQEGEKEDGQQVLILIDSLDMLITETELDHFEKGDTKGDQGQKNKQLKAMLRTFVQAIKNLNISMICTSQVYKNQDIKNGEGVWIVSDAVKYACSQILLVQKKKLRVGEGEKSTVEGVRIIGEGYKTRFTKPFQKVDVEVPYETGMDPYSGLLEAAASVGIILKVGNRWRLKDSDELWYGKYLSEHADDIIAALEKADLSLDLPEDEVDTTDAETKADTKARRKAKVAGDGEEE